MPDKTGQIADRISGAVLTTFIDQGGSRFAPQMSVAAPGGTISHGQATVTTSEVTLRAANAGRRSIIIQNLGAGTLFIGSAGVLSTTGMKIVTDGRLILDRGIGGAITAIASASCDVRFLEELS